MASKGYPLPKVFKSRSDEEVAAELSKWAARDINYWQERNSRFQRDQNLYKLSKPEGVSAKVESDIIVLNDPKVIVQKMSRTIARHPNQIEVPPTPGAPQDAAQRIENFLYSWDQATNQRWMAGLNNPYRFDQAFYLVLRGWLAERIMLNPSGKDKLKDDPSALWENRLFDPAHVYPYAMADKIKRVTHAYWTTVGEIRCDDFFDDKISKDFDDVEDDTRVQIVAQYWYGDDSWWHAVMLNGGPSGSTESRLIKKPRELGYNPWIITLAKGASYGVTDWDDIDHVKEKGTGILDESAENQRYLNRVVTKLNELLSAESNPAVSFFTGQGTPKKLDFGPGARNFFAAKDRVEAHRIGPNLNDFQLLWDILTKRAERATLPMQFFGEYGGESAFSATTLMAAGKDIFFPFAEGVNQADALKYRKVLELYRDFGPSTPLPSRTIPDGMGRVLAAEITPQDIKAQGIYVQVTRDEMTPQEMSNLINLGLAMLREKAISLDDFRRDYAKIKNPAKTNLRVLAEMVYMNEQVIQQLTPMALAANGEEHLRKVWELVQNPMPPAAPGGPPGPEPQAPGLPVEVLPAALQQGDPTANLQSATQLGAGMNPILAQLLGGGVLGGGGAGGLPPVPGTGSPVPLLGPGGGY